MSRFRVARLNELLAFKANYGHCDVPFTGDYIFLGEWCSEMRSSYKKIQNDQKRFNKLLAFKAKYGHCDIPFTGDYISLGKWCTVK